MDSHLQSILRVSWIILFWGYFIDQIAIARGTDGWKDAYAKANALVSRMTLDEKASTIPRLSIKCYLQDRTISPTV